MQQGLARIAAGKPRRAFAKFENAEAILAKFDPGDSAYTFLISCGKAIAFDCVGLRKECAEACIKVSHSLLAWTDEEETEEDDNILTSDEQEEFEKFFRVFKKAVRMSPTVEVRDFLFLIISIFEDE